jgi:hypothetical protein
LSGEIADSALGAEAVADRLIHAEAANARFLPGTGGRNRHGRNPGDERAGGQSLSNDHLDISHFFDVPITQHEPKLILRRTN